MVGSDMQGLILAAGLGARLHPFNLDAPKPLLPVCNKPIMQYAIEHLREQGIQDITVVVGHRGDRIQGAFGDGGELGVALTYVEQRSPLGIAHAVSVAESALSRPFVMCLGDIFFRPRQLGDALQLFRETRAGAVLAVIKEEDPAALAKNFSVEVDHRGRVLRVVEKPRHPRTNLKGCGVYVFDPSVFDAIRSTPRTAMRDEYEITTSIQILIDSGLPVYAAEVLEWDMNITFASDLLACKLRELERSGNDVCLGEGARVHHGARLSSCVVGNESQIEVPIRIAESVILPGTTVDWVEDLERVVVGPNGSIARFPSTRERAVDSIQGGGSG